VTFFFIFTIQYLLKIDIFAALHQKALGALNDGALEQQHALDIGMFNDGNRRQVGVFLGYLTSLVSGFRILQRCVIGCRGHGRRAHADADTGLVHHLEHAF